MVFCKISNQVSTPFILPQLPYATNSLEPHISAEAMEYHLKHHKAYVDNINGILNSAPELSGRTLEEIILYTDKTKNQSWFNNASQLWNHTFFFNSMIPNGGGVANGELLKQINKDFGSFEKFVQKFRAIAMSVFGSGWTWLVRSGTKLSILSTVNANSPITNGVQPIIVCDIWEHAYYVDYRNRRAEFIDAFLAHLVNWHFAENNFLATC